MSAKYMAMVREMPDTEKPQVLKKKNYVVFRHKPKVTKTQKQTEVTVEETSGSSSDEEVAEFIHTPRPKRNTTGGNFLTNFLEKSKQLKEELELELRPRKPKTKERKKPQKEPKEEPVKEPEQVQKQLEMYLPRRPGGFFKGVLIFSIMLMLILIFNNTDETLVLSNMSVMPSLPNIFDPAVLLSQKIPRVTDMMGDNEFVLIRENVTTVLEHRVFFRESVPRANVTSNGKTIVLLHDKHTEATGGTGCCSGLWLWLGTLHRLGREGFHVIAIDLPGYGFSEGIQLDIRESAPFMMEMIELFQLKKIILISPSTSIKVSLPFASSHPDFLEGLVIPSPTTTLKYTNEANMEKLKVPSLITFGDGDTGALSDYDKVLSKIPNHKLIKIDTRTVDDGVKLVYLDDPSHFHDHIVQFAKTLE